MQKADQFYLAASGDTQLQKTLIEYADGLEDWYRNAIWNTYFDPEVLADIKEARVANSLTDNGMTKGKTMREIVRIPSGPVYQFLKDLFEPIYGPKWLSEKKVLRHELVRPFWVVDKI